VVADFGGKESHTHLTWHLNQDLVSLYLVRAKRVELLSNQWKETTRCPWHLYMPLMLSWTYTWSEYEYGWVINIAATSSMLIRQIYVLRSRLMYTKNQSSEATAQRHSTSVASEKNWAVGNHCLVNNVTTVSLNEHASWIQWPQLVGSFSSQYSNWAS